MKYLHCLLIIFLFSCGSDNSKSEIEKEQEKEELRKIELERKTNELSKNLNIQYNWDTLDLSYSIDFTSILETESQILKQFFLEDLYQKNGQLFASISVGLYYNYVLNLEINELQAKSLRELSEQYDDSNLVLVVDISEIKKINIQFCESDSFFRGEGVLIEIVNLDSL